VSGPFNLLGLGFAGAAVIDGLPILLLPSSATEDDNHIKSQGTITNVISQAAGEISAPDTRSLSKSITAVLTPTSALLAKIACLNWRNVNALGNRHIVALNAASGEGYITSEAYAESVSINVAENSLGTVTFTFKSWNWINTLGGVTPVFQRLIDPLPPNLQPIPNWGNISRSHRADRGVFELEPQHEQQLGVEAVARGGTIPPRTRTSSGRTIIL